MNAAILYKRAMKCNYKQGVKYIIFHAKLKKGFEIPLKMK